MKTKHLFYAMALVASISACTNEEFLADASQENHKADRPVISNVSLEVDNTNTRLVYDEGIGGLQWETGDKIAAMLMDENNTGVRYGSATNTEEWNKLSWLEKYHLVDYVHTNFAFEYDGETWNSTGDCNMLEGNYFLAYPYVSFDGKRQAYYNIGTQKQVGNTKEARMKAFAENQKFIGYAQLEATAGATKLSTKLAGLLASVQIKLVNNTGNTDEEPLTVSKIVLKNAHFSSHYSIDPTKAQYGDWNLTKMVNDENVEGEVIPKTYFNYANYLAATGLNKKCEEDLYEHALFGSTDKEDYVYNVAEGKVGDVSKLYDVNPNYNNRNADEYYWDEALRKVVKKLDKDENWTENTTKYIEVYTYAEDGTSPIELKKGENNALGIWAMIPPYDINEFRGENNQVYLSIYTNKGIVGPVDLSEIHSGNTTGDVVTNNALLQAHPNMKTTKITVSIDADDIVKVNSGLTLVNNEDDLRNYVEWAKNSGSSALVGVKLTNDVTIDDDLATAIKELSKNNHAILYIHGSEGKKRNVRLAVTKDETKDILEYIEMRADALVQVVNGATVDLTSAAHNLLVVDAATGRNNQLRINVDEGGVLNIVDSNQPGIGGWNSKNVAKYCDVKLKNKGGKINVAADVTKNSGIRVNNEEGEMVVKSNSQILLAPKSTNEVKGTITIEAGGELSGTTVGNVTNYGDIRNAGKLYNVTNALANSEDVDVQKRVRPGYVYITDEAAQTVLEVNKGKVIYEVLPTVPVKVNGTDAYSSIFLYESEKDVTITELAAANVTDLVLNGKNLIVNSDKVQTNLRHLTVIGGSVVKDAKVTNVPVLKFGAATTDETLKNASWNTGANKVTLIGNGTTIENVKFYYVNGEDNEPCVFLKNGEGEENTTITFKGTVNLATKTSTYAIVDLEKVHLMVANGAQVIVDKFTAKAGMRSTIEVEPNGSLTAKATTDKYDEELIVVNGSGIK